MKRCAIDREKLAIHEAGHLLAMMIMPDLEPGDFVWRRLAHYEIAHIEPVPSKIFDWETSSDRNTLIARRSVVALAGGAAVAAWAYRTEPYVDASLEMIHEEVGTVDFELAHEWLTLQRYDPDQLSLESEIRRLFLEIFEVLNIPAHRTAIATVSQRILVHLKAADATCIDVVRVPARVLLDGLVLVRGRDFVLRETLANEDSGKGPTCASDGAAS